MEIKINIDIVNYKILYKVNDETHGKNVCISPHVTKKNLLTRKCKAFGKYICQPERVRLCAVDTPMQSGGTPTEIHNGIRQRPWLY